jgi:hypothetical protein
LKNHEQESSFRQLRAAEDIDQALEDIQEKVKASVKRFMVRFERSACFLYPLVCQIQSQISVESTVITTAGVIDQLRKQQASRFYLRVCCYAHTS